MVCIHIAPLLAPALGFEPSRPDLESGGLPLLQAGMSNKARINNLIKSSITQVFAEQAFNLYIYYTINFLKCQITSSYANYARPCELDWR